MMLIQEKEIRRIVQNEKEYRYGRYGYERIFRKNDDLL